MDHQPLLTRERRSRRRCRRSLLPVVVSALLLVTAGCRNQSGLDQQQEAQAFRLESIVKTSGGEWDRLRPADRDYLVRELGHGSETSARMLFAAKAGKLARPRPGGPAAPR